MSQAAPACGAGSAREGRQGKQEARKTCALLESTPPPPPLSLIHPPGLVPSSAYLQKEYYARPADVPGWCGRVHSAFGAWRIGPVRASIKCNTYPRCLP